MFQSKWGSVTILHLMLFIHYRLDKVSMVLMGDVFDFYTKLQC